MIAMACVFDLLLIMYSPRIWFRKWYSGIWYRETYILYLDTPIPYTLYRYTFYAAILISPTFKSVWSELNDRSNKILTKRT